jgi:hypothetical protein
LLIKFVIGLERKMEEKVLNKIEEKSKNIDTIDEDINSKENKDKTNSKDINNDKTIFKEEKKIFDGVYMINGKKETEKKIIDKLDNPKYFGPLDFDEDDEVKEFSINNSLNKTNEIENKEKLYIKDLEKELDILELEINFLKNSNNYKNNNENNNFNNEKSNIYDNNKEEFNEEKIKKILNEEDIEKILLKEKEKKKKEYEEINLSVLESEYNELKNQIFHLQRSNREVYFFNN